MGIPLYQVDAFTATRFAGNPAAICFLGETYDAVWMQQVAAEMNLSETAFLYPPRDGVFRLRWFTPNTEVDLCGHATLAAAHILWESGQIDRNQPARFKTRSGELTAMRNDNWIILDFPATPPREASAPPQLARALGATPKWVGRSCYDYCVELESEDEVRSLRPDLALLKSIEARGVMVTSRSRDSRLDFVSRFFGPAVGIDEDPACGSAHCCLAPYWANRLGKTRLTGYQASTRGGVVRVEVVGDRVKLGGQAVTVLRGELV